MRPVPGLPRRRRRAPRHRGRRRAPAAGGLLQRLRGVAEHARAGHRARAGGDGARPARHRRRGRRRPPRPSAPGEWVELDGVPRPDARRGSRPTGAAAARVTRRRRPPRRRAARRGQRGRHAAGLPRPLRRLRRRAHRGRAARRDADAARRARAASTCRAPGAASTTTASSSSRCRCCATAARCGWRSAADDGAGGPAPHGRLGGRTARRAGRDAAGRDAHCELCPLSIGEDHRHLLHLDERRIICVCETCWSMRSGDPSSGRPACARCGSRTSRCPTRSGRRSRSRSAWPSCCAAA